MKHELLSQMVKSFSEKIVKPSARDTDELERFPEENVRLMGEYGLMGLPYPKTYGGVGADTKAYIDTVLQISKYCATTGVILSAHTSLCAHPIYTYGNKEQKAYYLPKLNRGESLGAFALTEAGAGSDVTALQTKAVDMGDYYELTGNKIFITNAGYADIYIVFAVTDETLGAKGISAFIVLKDTEGFTVGPKEKKMGIRGSSTCELIFQKVKVPKENLLGRLGDGLKIALKTLDGGRIGIAAQALGIAEGVFEKAVQYIKERSQFGKKLSMFQHTQFVVAELKTKLTAGRLLLDRAVNLKDQNLDYSEAAAMAKLYNSKIAVEVSDQAIQLLGGYGYIRDYEAERYLRDAKITEIYEGTSEVQKMVIAGKVLK